ncbi:hypothetical protein [Natrinema hispanicum]|uniref:DUF7975 domain-containing protein n=1 Tax=Natrinema hispanicum TaxID=392421 RepID=A0A1G6IG21_9EURY|nr:hypothetical protein [Natrinema hispanicum]SDC05418.1 hypothetical protein SAMN05192552_1001252 [Natrinema hispanicum]SES84645.1 hypothetical protein SAMN04488694_10297 [Natrinema hispanicum]
MTRFDASTPVERRKLYVDAITAHRERASGFLTLEADDTVSEERDDTAEQSAAELGVPWIQFGDGTVNLDCTDAELEALKDLLEDFPAFKIDDLTRPEDAAGINVRVSAKADANRIAQFIDDVFLEVYDLPSTVRIWLVDV